MPNDLFIPIAPVTAVRKEVRASRFIGTNNLDLTTLHRFSATIERVAELQDGNGAIIGQRETLPAVEITAMQIVTALYTRDDGSTFTGAQFLADMQTLVDAHKGANLEPVTPEA